MQDLPLFVLFYVNSFLFSILLCRSISIYYGHESAQALHDYHTQNGGISRYKKFEYFLTEIMGKPIDQGELDDLLNRFAKEVKNGLMMSDVAQGLRELRKNRWQIG